MLIKQIASVWLLSLIFWQNGNCQNAGQSRPSADTRRTPAVNRQKQSEEQKKMDMLIKKILDKDPTAITMAKQLGSFASAGIKPLTASEDDVVREIAIRSLNQSGGSGVEDVFINRLSDSSPTVRAAALGGLNNHLSEEGYAQLLQTYKTVPDAQHRKEIARLLGRNGKANINDLRQICEVEEDAEALRGCRAARAKLGDEQAQTEFLERLREARGDELKEMLADVEYIKQIWALRGLRPVLNDKTPLTDTGFCQGGEIEPESSPENRFAEYLRACDMAVNLIAGIAGVKFSFPVNGVTNYTDAQLAEARGVLDTLL